MEIIREIGFQVIEILTLIFGVLGMTFSAMLVFAPNLTRDLSNILNRNIDVNKKIGFLDKNIEISEFFYSHNVGIGILIIAGSVFVLFFFYFSLDPAKFTKIFFDSPKQAFLGEIVIALILWVGKIACLAGLIFGSLLMFTPNKMKRLENKLNTWFEINPFVEKLDQSNRNLEYFFFRHPLPVGLTGAVLSFLILSLSITNLLD
jgi:hypothetical protein